MGVWVPGKGCECTGLARGALGDGMVLYSEHSTGYVNVLCDAEQWMHALSARCP